jgi:arylsulfatase
MARARRGTRGGVNVTGPRNLPAEPLAEKLGRIDDIGAPDGHSNDPLGWRWLPTRHCAATDRSHMGIAARGDLRHQFAHASDLTPTLQEVTGIAPPAAINGVAQIPMEGGGPGNHQRILRSCSPAS